MVAGGAACSDAPWVPAMSVTVTATNSPRVNVMFPLEAEHRSEDDAHLLALEVPSPFTHHPHVALVQVMHAGGGSTVLGEVACALVLLTESERNTGRSASIQLYSAVKNSRPVSPCRQITAS